jgi:hypothetical protein
MRGRANQVKRVPLARDPPAHKLASTPLTAQHSARYAILKKKGSIEEFNA